MNVYINELELKKKNINVAESYGLSPPYFLGRIL